jgi:phosphatidylinositol alpha-1,6-mannosyltransferase
MLAVMFSKRTDIIHIGDLVLWPLAVVAHIFRPSARLIITAYGLDIVYGTRKGLLPKIYNMYLALGVKLCSDYLRVIAISQATANLCRAVGFQDIVVVTLGVFTPVVTEVEVYKAENYVLFVGRLVKRKGAGWFIQNVLPFLDSKITLKIAGKPWDESEWDIISNNPRVEYLGVISNEGLRRYRQKAIAVLMPNIPTGGTDIEGFGLTALEAVADGGILLASGIEGIVDAVVDRETGFLLPAENVEAWKKNIEMISKWPEDERSLFIHQAQEILRNYFSWERVAQNTLVAYCNNYMKDARAG